MKRNADMTSDIAIPLMLGAILPFIIVPFQLLQELSQKMLAEAPFGRDFQGYAVMFLIIAALALLQGELVARLRIPDENPTLLKRSLQHGLKPVWTKVFICVIAGCLCSFFSGAALGSEAPSVYLGALLAALLGAKRYGRSPVRATRFMETGAAIGFSLAFANPLAGVFMQLNKDRSSRKDLSINLLTCTLSWIISSLLHGLLALIEGKNFLRGFLYSGIVFKTSTIAYLDLRYTYLTLLPALLSLIVIPLLGYAVRFLRPTLSRDGGHLRMISPWLCAAILFALFIVLPDSIGSGASYIQNGVQIAEGNPLRLIILTGTRLLLTILCFSTPILGGTIIPTIGLGSLLAADLLPLFHWLPADLAHSFIIAGGIASFIVATKKPLAGLALTLSFCPFLPAIINLVPAIALSSLVLSIPGIPSLSRQMLQADLATHLETDIYIGHHFQSKFNHGSLGGEEPGN